MTCPQVADLSSYCVPTRSGSTSWVLRLTALTLLACLFLPHARAQQPHAVPSHAPPAPSASIGANATPCSLAPSARAVAEAAMGQRGEFGAAVATAPSSPEGGVFCAVGAPNAMSAGHPRGRVSMVIFDGRGGALRPCSRIAQRALAPTGLSAHARFGAALDVVPAMGAQILAVGAPGADSDGGARAGLVRLYRVGAMGGGGQIPIAEFVEFAPAAGSAGASFGASVALRADGLQLAVGAPLAAAPNGPSFAGVVYVYGAEDGEWTLQFTVAPPRPSVAATFGKALAWVGGTLVVGAPGDGEVAPGAGRVYGVEAHAAGGGILWEVAPPANGGAASGMRFGEALSAIGDDGLAISGWGRGVVELLVLRVGGAPVHQALLHGNAGEGFGLRLAAADGRLYVAAPFAAGPQGEASAGRVETFVHRGDRWLFEGESRSASISANGEFGIALDAFTGQLGSSRVLVGEPGSHAACPLLSPCAAGAAYLF